MINVGLYGAAGHMGATMAKAISESTICKLAGGCERTGSPKIGEDLGTLAGLPPLGLKVTDDVAALCDASDVIVDYSAASATMSLLPFAIDRQTPVLVCTISRVTDYKAFAGATLDAAVWLAGQPPGLYSMDDMLRGTD